MTPIRGFFKRIINPSAPEEPGVSDDDRQTQVPTTTRERPDPDTGTAERDEDGGGRRRRGRRGGRGRRGSGSQNGNEDSGGRSAGESTTATKGRDDSRARGQRQSSQAGDSTQPRDYGWGRRVAEDEAHDLVEQRLERAQRRRRTNRRAGLDQPLPEDIAFRAAAEGGDRTILPARRRRPEGLRDTERVIIAGPRSLSGWMHWRDEDGQPEATAPPEPAATPAPPEPETPEVEVSISQTPSAETAEQTRPPRMPVSDAATEAVAEIVERRRRSAPADEPADDEDEAPSRRRRGRRGGRGRRRSDDAAGKSQREQTPAAEASGAEVEKPEAEKSEAEPPEAEPIEPEDAARPSQETARAVDPGEFPPAFVALGINQRTLETLKGFGYTEPTPIQERAIPALLNGLDVVGVAQTGSGKTVAFGVPMMERLDAELREVQGIVMVPTRELAQQVLDVLEDLGKPWGIEAIGLLGGRRLDADFRALKAKPHVVVGTPGRVIDHLNRGTLTLRHVRYAVLDEADQMLDIGFLPDIRRILSRTPKRRQTALFSATMPSSIRRLVWQFMADPETVSVDPELTTVESIEQVYVEVAQRDKVRGLRELIERELKGRTLVFSRTKRGVDNLEGQLSRDGVRVGALHGDMDQRRRDRVVQDFREGKLDILIATNVAARGLDIPEITHVVNYDVPQNAEEYVHRVGRTGRAGRSGKAITFVCEWDMQEFDNILQEFGDDVRKEELELYARRS